MSGSAEDRVYFKVGKSPDGRFISGKSTFDAAQKAIQSGDQSALESLIEIRGVSDSYSNEFLEHEDAMPLLIQAVERGNRDAITKLLEHVSYSRSCIESGHKAYPDDLGGMKYTPALAAIKADKVYLLNVILGSNAIENKNKLSIINETKEYIDSLVIKSESLAGIEKIQLEHKIDGINEFLDRHKKLLEKEENRLASLPESLKPTRIASKLPALREPLLKDRFYFEVKKGEELLSGKSAIEIGQWLVRISNADGLSKFMNERNAATGSYGEFAKKGDELALLEFALTAKRHDCLNILMSRLPLDHASSEEISKVIKTAIDHNNLYAVGAICGSNRINSEDKAKAIESALEYLETKRMLTGEHNVDNLKILQTLRSALPADHKYSRSRVESAAIGKSLESSEDLTQIAKTLRVSGVSTEIKKDSRHVDSVDEIANSLRKSGLSEGGSNALPADRRNKGKGHGLEGS
jgi:hypothetical protein